LRGEFPNPKRELLPGMYVRVLIEQGIDTDAIAVPQQAIQRKRRLAAAKYSPGQGRQPRCGSGGAHRVVCRTAQWFVTKG